MIGIGDHLRALVRPGRDLRIDFFRGMALWWIFMDHIGDNLLNRTTLRNFALCDATEVFVLLAGYAAAIAYGRTMDRQGYPYAAAHVLRRAWTLYIAHIFLFVVFTAQVAYSATALDRADYLDEIHINALGDDPYRALFEALTLHYQPAYLNILPMYIMLLVFFACVLPLLRRPKILAGLSFTVYAGARLLGLDLPSWTGGGWYFNPLTWQLLFMIGAILSYAPGEVPRHKRPIDVLAVIVAVFGIVEQWVIMDHPALTAHWPRAVTRLLLDIDKEGLHPFRLLSILALTWLTVRIIPAGAAWLQSRSAAAFVVCGQHSLPVFCVSIFLSFLGRLALEHSNGWAMQTGVNVVGAAVLASVGTTAAWFASKGRARVPRPAAPAEDANEAVQEDAA